MTAAEAREKLLAYFTAQKMGGVLAGPKDSPQIAKQTKIKPSMLNAVLRTMRHEGILDYSREEGWRLK